MLGSFHFLFFGRFDQKMKKISCYFQANCRFFIQKINKLDSWFFRFLVPLTKKTKKKSAQPYFQAKYWFLTENKQTGRLIFFLFWSLWPKTEKRKWNEQNKSTFSLTYASGKQTRNLNYLNKTYRKSWELSVKSVLFLPQ